MGGRGTRVWRRTLSADERSRISAACERFIADELKPRFLSEIRPTECNYPVDIRGRWHGERYRFVQRFRSGFPENEGEEFEEGFTRLDWIGPDRFDVMWHRHTGQWWRMFTDVSLDECFALIRTTGHLQPL